MSDLPITVESLDKVPEEFQKFYKPSEAEGDDGGKQYALDPSQVFEAMGAINKALDNQRRVNDSLEKEKKEISKKYEHVDLKKYQQLEEKSKEWETEKERQEREALEAKGQYEEALEKAKATHSKEIADIKADFDKKLKGFEGERDQAISTKRNYILGDKLRRAIVKAGVFADDIEDVLTLTRNRFTLNDKDQVVVLDDAGNESDDTLDNFFGETFKKSKPKFYQGTGSSGSGSPAGGSKGGSGASANADELSATEKISRGLSQRK